MVTLIKEFLVLQRVNCPVKKSLVMDGIFSNYLLVQTETPMPTSTVALWENFILILLPEVLEVFL